MWIENYKIKQDVGSGMDRNIQKYTKYLRVLLYGYTIPACTVFQTANMIFFVILSAPETFQVWIIRKFSRDSIPVDMVPDYNVHLLVYCRSKRSHKPNCFFSSFPIYLYNNGQMAQQINGLVCT